MNGDDCDVAVCDETCQLNKDIVTKKTKYYAWPSGSSQLICRGLCYSCRLIPREIRDAELSQPKNTKTPSSKDENGKLDFLPTFVVRDAFQRQSKAEITMREKIQDFLLDDT